MKIIYKLIPTITLCFLFLSLIAQPPSCAELAKKRELIDKNLQKLIITNIPDAKPCETEAEYNQRIKWNEQIMAPYHKGMTDMLRFSKEAAMAGCDDLSSILTNKFEQNWLEDCYKELIKVMKTNDANSAKMIALVPIALKTIAESYMIGSDDDYEKGAANELNKVTFSFLMNKTKIQLSEIKDKHKYEYATAVNIMRNEAAAQMAGNDMNEYVDYFELYSKAMTFDLQLGISARRSFRVGGVETYTAYETLFEKPLKIKLKNMMTFMNQRDKQKEYDANLDNLSPSMKEFILTEEKAISQEINNDIGYKLRNVLLKNACDDKETPINISALDNIIKTRNKDIFKDLGQYDLIEVPYNAFQTITGKDMGEGAKSKKIAPDKITLKVFTTLSRCGDTLVVGLLAPEVAENESSGFEDFRCDVNCQGGKPIYGDASKSCYSCGTYLVEAWKDNISPIPNVTCSNFMDGFSPMFLDEYPMDIIKEYKHIANRPVTNYFSKLLRAKDLPWQDKQYYTSKKEEVPIMNMVILKIPLISGKAQSGMYSVVQTIKQTSKAGLITNDLFINAKVTHTPQN